MPGFNWVVHMTWGFKIRQHSGNLESAFKVAKTMSNDTITLNFSDNSHYFYKFLHYLFFFEKSVKIFDFLIALRDDLNIYLNHHLL